MMPTIEEQCPALGYTMPELLGRSAGQLRALGFEIPPQVEDNRTLGPAQLAVTVDVSTHGHATGYAWFPPKPAPWLRDVSAKE